MSSSSIFVTPTASQNTIQLRTGTKTEVTRKRKRIGQDASLPSEIEVEDSGGSDSNRALSTEYTAVVTPTERSQRRLAGLNLDQAPPPSPFPHAREHDSDNERDKRYHEDLHLPQAEASLHSQHIAAMMAVLYRSTMAGDYTRAGRALGLLLRNEMGGHAIDIRKAGLWGIGAEVLLRKSVHQAETHGDEKYKQAAITREGFERAKLYYERLIVQYPPHKTWPDAVNSRDFCIALFGLWIYVTDRESLQMQGESSDDTTSSDGSGTTLLDAKRWELQQAVQIAEAMDLRLRDSPFNNDRELIRLRAMVALWTADLLDKRAQLEDEDDSIQKLREPEQEDTSADQVERVAVDVRYVVSSTSDDAEAVAQRAIAETFSRRLQDIDGRDHGSNGS